MERYAFWRAYGRLCYICRAPVTLGEAELDHIIPEYLDGSSALINVIKRVGLPDSFKIRSYENISLACGICNNRKSDRIFPDALLILHLQIASTRANRVRDLIDFHKRQTQSDLYRYFLKMARQHQPLASKQENNMSQHNALRKSVNEKFMTMMSSLTIDDVISRSANELENYQIFDEEGIQLVNDQGDLRETKTYAEYRSAKNDGYAPSSTVDIKTASGIFEPFGALIGILKASAFPKSSFIDIPREGVTSLRLIPSSILEAQIETSTNETSTKNERSSGSIDELVRGGRAQIYKVDSDEVGIIADDFYNNIVELARTDLDGDGIEDILAIVNVQSVSGTLGYSRMVLLHRRDDNAMFEIEPFSVSEHSDN